MDGLAVEQRVGQRIERGAAMLRREAAFQHLHVAVELEAEVLARAGDGDPLMLARAADRELRGAPGGVLGDQVVRQGRPLDRRARHTEAVGEEAQSPRYRAPAPRHRRLRHPRLLAVGGALVDDQVERHDAGEQVGEALAHLLRHVGQRLRERGLERPVHRCGAERDVLDGLHQHAAPLGPLLEPVLEQVARQPVHLPEIAVLVHRLRVDVVRGQVVAAVGDEAVQVALVAGHPVQRIDVGADGDDRRELGIGVHQQLAPGAVHRERLHLPAVAGEAAVLDQAPRTQGAECPAVGGAVERNRELEILGVHAERGAGDGHPLGVARELELGRGGHQLLEDEVAVAQDPHLASRDPAMHAAGHLEDLVGAEVHPVQHVAAALDDVAVARVVDHHGVEPAHVERALPRRGHGEQPGALDLGIEEGADHPDRLAAMVERRGEPLPLLAELGGELLHLGAGRDEDRDAALLLDDAAHEPFVQELERLLAHDLDARGELRVEGTGHEHLAAAEVLRVEGGIDGGAEPDEAAAGALAQRQAELELGRGLVDLVHHDGVVPGDQVVLEPAPRDSGGDDDDVPRRRLRRRLALPVDHAEGERLAQDGLGDRPDAERLAGAGAGHDAEGLPLPGPFAQLLPVLPLEQRVHVEPERQLDRLAGGARRGDDDDAAAGMGGSPVRFGIDREVVVAGGMHGGNERAAGGKAQAESTACAPPCRAARTQARPAGCPA